MAQDLDCLYSSVRNISGSARYFGFLPPHGVTLAANEEYLRLGNIMEDIRVNFGDRVLQHFADAIADGLLEMKYTPSPVLYDAGHDRPGVLHVLNDTLSFVDPCWDSAAA